MWGGKENDSENGKKVTAAKAAAYRSLIPSPWRCMSGIGKNRSPALGWLFRLEGTKSLSYRCQRRIEQSFKRASGLPGELITAMNGRVTPDSDFPSPTRTQCRWAGLRNKLVGR